MRAYLIRHGQAGPRDDYDRLSELGKRQAQALGRHFQNSAVQFKAAFAGGMRRQQETAAIALSEMANAPPLQIDPRWNEFSLDGLWQKVAPLLLESSQDFARDYLEHESSASAERVLTSCDVELIRAWIGNHYPCDSVETWAEFRARVDAARSDLSAHASQEAVAVFTSGTPMAICCAAALGLDDHTIFRIAAVIYNASYTTLRVRANDVTLFSLNNTAHLTDPGLLTFR